MAQYNKLLWDRYRPGYEDNSSTASTVCTVSRQLPLIEDAMQILNGSDTKRKRHKGEPTETGRDILRFHNLVAKPPRPVLTDAELKIIEESWDLLAGEGLWP